VAFLLFYFLEHHLLIHAGHEEQHHIHLTADDCREALAVIGQCQAQSM
jgi:hypothetical protein